MIRTPTQSDVDLFLFFCIHAAARHWKSPEHLIQYGKQFYFPYGFKAPALPKFPVFPDICVCGEVFSATGSCVRSYCPHCKGCHRNNEVLYFVTSHWLPQVCEAFNIPYYYAIAAYAKLRYQRAIKNENTSSKQSILFRFANIALLPEEILSR